MTGALYANASGRLAWTLRAELAQLRAREKQLRLRSAAVSAAHGRVTVKTTGSGAPTPRPIQPSSAAWWVRRRQAWPAAPQRWTRRSAGPRRRGLSRSAAAHAWTIRSGPELAAAPLAAPDIDLDMAAGESARRPARSDEDAALAAEADAVLEECRLRCPETDLTELTALRAELGRSPLGDRAVIQDMRARAARTIQWVKRENELEEQRQRLFVLAEEAPAAERAALRRWVAEAPPGDLPRLDREVTAAVERASAERARAEAVAALEQSLLELGYDVQGGFATLLPATAASAPGQRPATATQPTPRFLVAASPHSAERGLRVRVGPDQVYLSVVRRAGTARRDVRRADTEVQEMTCRDLVTAAAAAAGKGVQISWQRTVPRAAGAGTRRRALADDGVRPGRDGCGRAGRGGSPPGVGHARAAAHGQAGAGQDEAARAVTGDRAPAWVREIDFSLVLHPQILLTGNVRDSYRTPVAAATDPSGAADTSGAARTRRPRWSGTTSR